MKPSFKVGRFTVGGDAPAWVIAEAGCNHENDFPRAKEMVRAAADAGVHAIKFQSFTASKIVTRDARKFWDIPGCPGQTQLEEFKEIEPNFTRAQYLELFALADKAGVACFSTPCDEQWADYLEELGAQVYKIMSMDITHFPLIRHVARKKKPVILSTGASTLDEIREAVSAIVAEGNREIALLHCVSSYPAPAEQVNLRMIGDLEREFPDCVIGYSDHTLPDLVPPTTVVAVASGAKIIEKHFTFDSKRPGYDHEISSDYAATAAMMAQIRQVETVLGSTGKKPVAAEQRAREMGRRSIVAAVDIPKGTTLEAAMLAVKRPGNGIPPKHLPELLGRKTKADISSDQLLSWEVLA